MSRGIDRAPGGSENLSCSGGESFGISTPGVRRFTSPGAILMFSDSVRSRAYTDAGHVPVRQRKLTANQYHWVRVRA